MRLRCRLGFHDWHNDSTWGDDWRCTRCDKTPKRCRNCGGQHNPNASLIICTVHRGTP